MNNSGSFGFGFASALVAAVLFVWVIQDTPAKEAAATNVQLEGAIPVEVASNAVQSNWQDSYVAAIERCWRGVTYVVFFAGGDTRSNVGGSAVILPDGKPLLCDTTK
jgi:hypothetical protein